MTSGVLARMSVTPDRLAGLTAAGDAIREGQHAASRIDAGRAAAAPGRAGLTNGRGGLSGAAMTVLPQREIVCAAGAGSEATALAPARLSCQRRAWDRRGYPGPPRLPELLPCDTVVVPPHVAGRAPESRPAATAMIRANLNVHVAGQPLPSPGARTT